VEDGPCVQTRRLLRPGEAQEGRQAQGRDRRPGDHRHGGPLRQFSLRGIPSRRPVGLPERAVPAAPELACDGWRLRGRRHRHGPVRLLQLLHVLRERRRRGLQVLHVAAPVRPGVARHRPAGRRGQGKDRQGGQTVVRGTQGAAQGDAAPSVGWDPVHRRPRPAAGPVGGRPGQARVQDLLDRHGQRHRQRDQTAVRPHGHVEAPVRDLPQLRARLRLRAGLGAVGLPGILRARPA